MYYHQDTQIFLDGQFLPAAEASTSLYAQTLHYGSGVFEGIRAYATPSGTKIFKPIEHYQRLLSSAQVMHIQIPYTAQQLTELTYELLQRNQLQDAYIRPLVYLGDNMSLSPTAQTHVAIMAWEWGKYLGDQLLRVRLSPFQRPNPKACFVEAKVVGHYTNSILATTEAKQAGFDEALLTDMHGFVAEGPGANFFYEKDTVLYTPPLGNILAGITRATVFELAAQLQIPIVEAPFTPDALRLADSAFFCGTAAEIIGIASLDDYQFPLHWPQTQGARLQQAYQQLVRA